MLVRRHTPSNICIRVRGSCCDFVSSVAGGSYISWILHFLDVKLHLSMKKLGLSSLPFSSCPTSHGSQKILMRKRHPKPGALLTKE